jgi:hypothetical protein
MRRRIAIACAAAAIAVIQASFLAALPAPFFLLQLPLLLIVGLAAAFRFGDMFLAAVVSGSIAASLSPADAFPQILLMPLLAFILMVLVTRVFAHHSLPALIGLNGVGFLVLFGLRFAAAAVAATLDGNAWSGIVTERLLIELGTSLVLQMGFAALTVVAMKRFKTFFSSMFFIAR